MAGGPEMMAAQAAMQIVGGIAENSALRKEARALDENGRVIETQGAYDAVDALRRSRMQAGADVAAAAAGGSGLASFADVIEANAVERQMEAMNIRFTAMSKADGLRAEASMKRDQGKAAIFGGILRAGASAIQSAGSQRAQGRIDAATARSRQPLGTIPIPASATLVAPDAAARRSTGPWANW